MACLFMVTSGVVSHGSLLTSVTPPVSSLVIGAGISKRVRQGNHTPSWEFSNWSWEKEKPILFLSRVWGYELGTYTVLCGRDIEFDPVRGPKMRNFGNLLQMNLWTRFSLLLCGCTSQWILYLLKLRSN